MPQLVRLFLVLCPWFWWRGSTMLHVRLWISCTWSLDMFCSVLMGSWWHIPVMLGSKAAHTMLEAPCSSFLSAKPSPRILSTVSWGKFLKISVYIPFFDQPQSPVKSMYWEELYTSWVNCNTQNTPFTQMFRQIHPKQYKRCLALSISYFWDIQRLSVMPELG